MDLGHGRFCLMRIMSENDDLDCGLLLVLGAFVLGHVFQERRLIC